MDWFHCNRCFRRRGQDFAVSTCGHICCAACIIPKQCNICGASCSYLPITDKMKPQEKVFFTDPLKLIQSGLEHVTQIALFQRKQKQRTTAFFQHKSAELERRLKEVTEQGYRQLSELKRENAELKKPLSQRRISPGQFPTNGAQMMSLPVAVTSPVTPYSRNISHPGSAEFQGRARGPRLSLATPPGPATPILSHSSLHIHRTPPSFTTPTRTQHQIPNIFLSSSRIHPGL